MGALNPWSGNYQETLPQSALPPLAPALSFLPLSPSVARVRIPSQTENMVAIPGPRCQYVAASGLLARIASSCAGCFEACHVAEPANGALSQNGVSLRIWFQPRSSPENNERPGRAGMDARGDCGLQL